MQPLPTPSLGGSPMPARRRYALRTALVLAAATAVVPLAATAASAERMNPLPSPTAQPQDDGPRTRIYQPTPKPTIVITTVQPGGGIATQVPPVIVACKPPNDCTPPADDPVGPGDEANPTPGPVDPGDNADGTDPADDTDTDSTDDGSGSAPGTDDGDTDGGDTDGGDTDGTTVDPTLAPDLGTGDSADSGDVVDESGTDGTAEGYAEHGQSPADPVQAPPYTLIAGLGLLGAGLVGLVALAITRRPQA